MPTPCNARQITGDTMACAWALLTAGETKTVTVTGTVPTAEGQAAARKQKGRHCWLTAHTCVRAHRAPALPHHRAAPTPQA